MTNDVYDVFRREQCGDMQPTKAQRLACSFWENHLQLLKAKIDEFGFQCFTAGQLKHARFGYRLRHNTHPTD